MTTFCANCNRSNIDGARFCSHCGKPITAAVPLTPAADISPGRSSLTSRPTRPASGRVIWVAIAISLLVAVVAVAASPFLALQGVRDALASRNTLRLGDAVDFAALRPNLVARVHQRQLQTGGPAAAPPGTPDPIDRLLAPDGLIRAICDGNSLPATSPVTAPCEVQSRMGDVRFESASRYSASLSLGSTVVATLVLQRRGMRWRVVDVVLPASALD